MNPARFGRSMDDLEALETLDAMTNSEAIEIAQYAVEIAEKTELDAIDAVTLLMKVGRYFATHAGVRNDQKKQV